MVEVGDVGEDEMKMSISTEIPGHVHLYTLRYQVLLAVAYPSAFEECPRSGGEI